MKTLKTAKWASILISVATAVLGILLFCYPEISVNVLCGMLGALLLLCGIFRIIGYFTKDLYRLAFQFDFALGLFACAIGLILLLCPERVITMLYVVIGVTALIDALLRLQTAVDAKRFGMNKWGVIFVIALLTALLGLLLVLAPFEGAVLLMRIAGLTFFAEGVLSLFVIAYTVKEVKHDKVW